jgi:hypothetical protein
MLRWLSPELPEQLFEKCNLAIEMAPVFLHVIDLILAMLRLDVGGQADLIRRPDIAERLRQLIESNKDEGVWTNAAEFVNKVGGLLIAAPELWPLYFDTALLLLESPFDSAAAAVIPFLKQVTKEHVTECSGPVLERAALRLAAFYENFDWVTPNSFAKPLLELIHRTMDPAVRSESTEWILAALAGRPEGPMLAALFEILIKLHEHQIPCGDPDRIVDDFRELLLTEPQSADVLATTAFMKYFKRKVQILKATDRSAVQQLFDTALAHAIHGYSEEQTAVFVT